MSAEKKKRRKLLQNKFVFETTDCNLIKNKFFISWYQVVITIRRCSNHFTFLRFINQICSIPMNTYILRMGHIVLKIIFWLWLFGNAFYSIISLRFINQKMLYSYGYLYFTNWTYCFKNKFFVRGYIVQKLF